MISGRRRESGVGQTPTTPDPSSFSRRTQGDSFGILLGALRKPLQPPLRKGGQRGFYEGSVKSLVSASQEVFYENRAV